MICQERQYHLLPKDRLKRNIMDIRVVKEIHRPIKDVFRLISDVMKLPTYDKAIRDVKQITPDSIGVGSIFHLIGVQIGFRMVAELEITTYEPNQRFGFRVNSKPFPVMTDYMLTFKDGATQISGVREPKASGFWNWLMPVISIPARFKFETELERLKSYLEGHSSH